MPLGTAAASLIQLVTQKPQRSDLQVAFRDQLAREGDPISFIFFADLGAAHFRGSILAVVEHLHAADTTTAAAAAHWDPFATQSLHREQNILPFFAQKAIPTIGNSDFEAPRLLNFVTQNFLNKALRRAGSAPSAAVRNDSMKICSSNKRPCIKVVMQASIIGGGPQR